MNRARSVAPIRCTSLTLVLVASLAAAGCSRSDSARTKRARAAPAPGPSAAPPPPAPGQPSTLQTGDGGQSVYDPVLDVTWLANGNLAAKDNLGVRGVKPSGQMTYKDALRWIDKLNDKAHLGSSDWQLPVSPPEDPGCGSHNRYSFGYGCTKSAFAQLYSRAFGLRAPQPAVALPMRTSTAGFTNFQPYLYWSATENPNHPENENGFVTFSFANGFQGSNVQRNNIFALPMVPGKFEPSSPADRARVVHDDGANVTWLADANLAASQTFGVAGIAPNGSMPRTVAVQWIAAMNRHGGKGYLGRSDWQLPPTIRNDGSCSKSDFGLGCKGSPMGKLYYGKLGLTEGRPVVAVPDTPVGPFHDLQPYLYWSCHLGTNGKCAEQPDLPVAGFGWSFSFANGFQGTTTRDCLLYVIAYHPGRPKK